VSMSNESPFESPSSIAHRVDDPTRPANGTVVSHPSSKEFALFLQHAERLEREGSAPRSLRAWLDLAEAWRITQVLRACKGNRSAAARELGIGRRTLYSKMEKLEITPTWTI